MFWMVRRLASADATHLGFSPEDRAENVRRAAVAARPMTDAGQFVLAALISPRAAERQVERDAAGEGFRRIHVDASREVCDAASSKAFMLRRALAGFRASPGSMPHEEPASPYLVAATTVTAAAERPASHVAYLVALPGFAARTGVD